ncbi:hypothetical protein J2W56_001169 [Nocardia kruczakiae]|uniref:Transmembrane protein n=1 Tax=Nocardia kruczakiae TaxID=261477 RepID=A0ABU1XA80_9NOCA|nr:hypothetical protein [Nocardia kruczakiae]MDR7167451.1 hypothetical protein [Nocardia kruczakiae]
MVRTTFAVLRAGRIAPWTRSPLMRPADRVEQALRLALVVSALAAVLLAVVAGTAQYRVELAAIHADNATKTAVTAEVTSDPIRMPAPNGMFADQLRAQAQWSRDGHPGQAMVDVDGTTHRGDRIPLWLTGQGDPTTPPVADDAAVAKGIASGTAALLACWALAYGLARGAGYALDRRRAGEWEREWRQISRQVGHGQS